MLFNKAVEKDKALRKLLVRLIKPGHFLQGTGITGVHREHSIGIGEKVLHKVHGAPQKLHRLLQGLFSALEKQRLQLCAYSQIILYIALVGGVVKALVNVCQIPLGKCVRCLFHTYKIT